MSIHILVCESPYRSIALITTSYALTFRCYPSDSNINKNVVVPGLSTEEAATSRCIVEFQSKKSIDLNNYQPLSPLPIHGTLGLITVNNNIFICVVTGATRVASVRPGETAEKIYGVEFYCLNTSNYDNSPKEVSDQNNLEDGFLANIRGKELSQEHPCADLQRLLCDGSFYFSTDVDLTNRLQDRDIEVNNLDMDHMDTDFLWNSFMINPLIKFRSQLLRSERKNLDSSRTLTSAIRGFIMTLMIPSSPSSLLNEENGAPSSLTLISRLSCRRAGTRFNSRGIDDDGNVANFVESEIVYYSPLVNSLLGDVEPSGICFSYVQIRGSVPIFWEQAAGLIPGQQKITMTRSPEGTLPSFHKHFSELERKYGLVHIVNLLSENKASELELANLYRKAVKNAKDKWSKENYFLDPQFLKQTEFDFHAETKGPGGYESATLIRRLIKSSSNEFSYFLCEDQIYSAEDYPNAKGNRTFVISHQKGVFRTNCLDCLDRTNLIQSIISQMVVEAFLAHQNKHVSPDFWMSHSNLWADNGDSLSRIYAGTGALKSSFTRHGKMSFAGALADARKSATRLYINNFADKARQQNIDFLLGRSIGQKAIHLFDPINEYVMTELSKKTSKYRSFKTIKIWCGTFNLNGRNISTEYDLSPWLFPSLDHTQESPEIVATGFQEIVELSPQQIMNSDPKRKEAWEKLVLDTINKKEKLNGNEYYVMLRSGQLIGASLMIFVKKSALFNIRNVEGSVLKTGMSGMAGNKGAVAIRMDYADTPICFVTAHFAAGFKNYEERNNNFATINHSLRFQRNRGINDHYTVIWMGDFNYRIALDNEIVRNLIKNEEIDILFQNDQLNLQMIAGLVFPSYSESKITFAPTYKFDVGTNTYDTSEKSRIPAWTDRILLKGENTRQICYNSAPLQFSDHRPVYGIFLSTVSITDEQRKESLSRQIFEERKSHVNDAISEKNNNNKDKSKLSILGSNLDIVNSERTHSQLLSQKIKLPTPQKSGNTLNKSYSVIKPQKPPKPPVIGPSLAVSNNSNTPRVISKKSSIASDIKDVSNVLEYEVLKKSNLTDHEGLHNSSLTPTSAGYLNSDRSKSSTYAPSRQVPPPIARKPLHLTSTTKLSSTTSIISPTSKALNGSPPISISETKNIQNREPHGKVESKKSKDPPPSPLPRNASRVAKNPPLSLQPQYVSKGPWLTSKESYISNKNVSKPNVPPRKKSSTTLLEGDLDSSINGWKALEPENQKLR